MEVCLCTPPLKAGDSSTVSNYRPISKLCVLSKVLQRLVNNQLQSYLDENRILSPFQSGFRKLHSTGTASIKVLKDVYEALDAKNYCAALFIDLSKSLTLSTTTKTLLAQLHLLPSCVERMRI